MAHGEIGEVSWERMIRAVERVRERLLRAAKALDDAGVSYAVVGGNAVAAWVSRIDETAARNTQDVDLLIRRNDFPAVEQALTAAGFVSQNVGGLDLFLDGPDATVKQALHVVFAGERVRDEHPLPAPDVDESEATETFRLISLEALVRMKLNAYRDKDRTHLRDLIGVGLVDDDWPARLPAALGERLQQLLDTPDG